MSKILKFEDFINSRKSEGKAHKLDLEAKKEHKSKDKVEEKEDEKLPAIEEGDYVEDRFGNTYEVIKTTTDFKEADAIDDWDNITKFKDDPDAVFVIVWAKETHQKKLVFVYGVNDEVYSIKKVSNKAKEDFFTATFRKACENVKEERLETFKKKWRKFIDMVRAGDLDDKTERNLILNQILLDYDVLDVIKKQDKKEDDSKNGDEAEELKESAVYEKDEESGDEKPKKEDKPKKEEHNDDKDRGSEPKDDKGSEEKTEPKSKDEDNSKSGESGDDKDTGKSSDDEDEPAEKGEDEDSGEQDGDDDSEGDAEDSADSEEETLQTDRKAPGQFSRSGQVSLRRTPTKEEIEKARNFRSEIEAGEQTTSQPSEKPADKPEPESKPKPDSEGSSKKDDFDGEAKSKSGKTPFYGKAEKITVGGECHDGVYEIDYGNKVYYVKPDDGDEEVYAYYDEACTSKVTSDKHELKFKISDLFNIEKFIKTYTTYAEPYVTADSEEKAKERAEDNEKDLKKEAKKKDKEKDDE